ncbi:MAG TPA: hypothetical protein VGT98_02940 [Candidatus Elarobacter sp.]|nr:hypothetical protein [Candidatus Elarobacter sp.]
MLDGLADATALHDRVRDALLERKTLHQIDAMRIAHIRDECRREIAVGLRGDKFQQRIHRAPTC